MKPQISIIIPTFNDGEALRDCLHALLAQDFIHPYEVLVVDNGSSNPPNELEAMSPKVKVLTEPAPGSYRARNLGIHCAKSDLIAFTDADCRPKPCWLTEIFNTFSAQPDVGLIGGKISLFFKEAQPTSVELYESVYAFRQKDFIDRGRAMTANLAVRRAVFDAVGVFQTQSFSGGDLEFTGRATGMGFKLIYCEKAEVLHPARRTLKEIRSKAKRTVGGQYKLRDKSSLFRRNLSAWGVTKDFLVIPKRIYELLIFTDRSLRDKIRICGVILHNQAYMAAIKTSYLIGWRKSFYR